MNPDSSERIRKAARDGYLDILRDATRKECNAPDEDGMTATHWAAFSGNLDALRIIVGRGGDPGKSDFFGNTALHWSAVNGHFNCVSFLVSFGVNLWSLDNQFHSAKEVAALNNSPQSLQIIQFLDHVVAKQSALNTKVVQKMKEKALAEAEKRVKAFQKMQTKTTKQAEKEEKLREKHRKKNMCLLNPSEEAIYSDLNHNETHIYEMPSSGKAHYHSTISSNSSTMKFSDLVNSSLKSTKSGTARLKIPQKILSGVSRKVLIRKQNSTDTMKSSEAGDTASRGAHALVGIRRDDQIVYVPKYGSLSVTNLTTNLSDTEHEASDQSKFASNSRLHLKDVFNLEGTHRPEQKTSTFNKSIKSSIKSRLLKFNHRQLPSKERPGGSLYRTISEPDFMFLEENRDLESKNDSLPTESSSIFERPGFGSVSFRGKFTPESLFFMPRYYRADSAGNSEDDADSGHDHSHDSNGGSLTKKYLANKKAASSLSPDRDSFASDSIGSAGSLVQPDCLEDHFGEQSPECLASGSKSIPVLLFLYAHGLKEYYDVFEAEKIDIDALMLLTEDDLVSLAIPLGPRRKLLNAIRQRRLLLDSNGHVFETKL